jgi:flagellar hook-length control protein FliK
MSASPLALLAALPPAGKTSPNAANTVPQKASLHAAEVGIEATTIDDTDAPADKLSFAQLLREQTSTVPEKPLRELSQTGSAPLLLDRKVFATKDHSVSAKSDDTAKATKVPASDIQFAADVDGKTEQEPDGAETSEVTAESSAQLSAWLAALMKAPAQTQAQEPTQGRLPGSTVGHGTPTDLEHASKGVAQALSTGVTARGDAKTGLLKPALITADKAAGAEGKTSKPVAAAADKAVGADGKATKSAAPSLAREAAAAALEASRATLSGPSPSGVAGSAATSGTAAASEALQAAKASAPRPGTGENGPSQVVLNHLATGAASASATVAASASPQATAAAAVSDTFIAQDVRRPEFVPVFSARIATLVQEGIEQARVHLNPLDMGPVSLQLSLDGLQVRVDMTAEVAATRQVLEQALPSLAGALREAGFTLSGGGVAPPAEAANTGGQDHRGSSGSSGEPNPQASTGSNAMSGQQADGRRQAEGEPGRTPVGSSVGIAEGLTTEVHLDADGTPRLAQGRGLIDTFA